MSQTNNNCYGDNSGAVTINPTGGTAPYSITWTGPNGFVDNTGADFSISQLYAGTYTYTINDANNCGPYQNTVTILQGNQILPNYTTINACFDGTGGSITLSPTGGTGIGFYAYDVNSSNIYSLSAGAPTTIPLTANNNAQYDWYIFDNSNTCHAEIFFSILSPSAAVGGSATSTNITCNGSGNGMIQVTGTGGFDTYQYSLDGTNWVPNGGTSTSYTFMNLGTNGGNPYTVQVRDASQTACVYTIPTMITITEPNVFTSGSIDLTNSGQTICYGGTPGTIGSAVDASGGDNSITYSWRSSADGYTAAISGATGATYTPPAGLTVTTSYQRYANDGTCNTTPTLSGGTWTVNVDAQFTSGSIDLTNSGQTICYGGTPGTIGSAVDASGGDNSITYSWRSSADGYTAAISGATGATYTPPAGLTVTTSYQRYANDGTCNTTPTLSGGTWTVNVDAQFTSGSIKTDGETICNGQTPTKTIGSATDASGGDGTITYSWEISTDGGNNYTPISGANGSSYLPTQSITTTTLYRRLANDGTCNTTPTLSGGTWTVNVSPSTLITGDLSTTPYNICSSPVGTAPTLSVVASGSGTLTYQWYSNSTGTVDLIHDTKISTSSTFSPDISQAGTKYYYVVVSGNCGNATSSVAQVVVKPLPATPSAIIAIQSSPICAGTSGVGYSVANDPTLTYNWTYSGTGYSINGNGGSSITIDFGAGATGGTLSVTSTLNNGCGVSAASTLPITISGIPTTANAGPDQTAPCGQTSVTLAANSPIVGTGHWTSDGGSFTDANSPTSTFTGSYGVTYHLTWTISNSPCNTSSDDVAITFEAPITFTATKGSHNGADVSCSTSADGSIVVSAQGGSGNFQYSKDNGVNFQTSNEFDNLAATTYKIIVKDDKGCVSAEQDVTLVAPKSITVSTNAGSILCNGNAAVLIVTANGGTGSYQYTLLQNGVPVGSPQSSSILNVFAGTNYSIMVSDANNCSGTSTPFTITQPPALGIAITNQTASGCSGPGTGSVTVIGTGGVAPYSYGFNGSATYSSTNTFVNLAAGGYTISVKDVNGCTASLSVTITGGSAPAVHNVIGGNSCNTNTGLTIGLDGADQGVTYVLLRDGNQIGVTFTSSLTGVGFTFSPAQTTPGTYTVVATSGGCQSTMNGSATLSAAPAVQNVSGGGTYCSGGVGLFIGLDNSETNVSYQLYMGNTKIGSPIPGTTGQQLSFGPEPLQGVYTIVATSAAGCTTLMNGTATINVSAAPSGYTLSAGLSNCSGKPITLTLNETQNGYKQQKYNSSNATIGSAIVAQNDGTISMGSVLTGSYYVIGTAPAGCIGNPSNTVSVSAGSAPSIFTVGGDGGSYCTGGLGSVVTLSGSELGVTYELISNGNIVVDVNGTGNSISFGPQTAGVYTVTAINTTTACSASMSGSATISENSAKPTFSTQLSSPGTVCPGVTVTLSVQSPEAISYQWYYNNGAINGQTGSSLILSSVTVANAGSYYVVAIGSCGNTQSSVVQLGVNVAPSISSQPLQTQTVCSGSAVTFQVTASNSDGSTPTYQWYFGGTQITGATSSFYTIPSVSSGNQGVYYVIVSNACNLSTQSSTASLFVNTSPSVAAIGGGGSTVCVNGTIPAFTDATPGGHWSVLSGTGTASIDDNGVVTGLTAGTVTIQYSVTGCGTTTVTTGLTVLGAPVVNAIAGGTSVICVGSQTPAFTDATPGGIWSVINVSGSANINQNGVVTATGVGQVTVQYSVANSCSTTIVSATLNISSLTQPTFATIPAQCAGGVSPLPTISNESITGIWTPAFDPNNTKTYTFISNSGQCASATTQITVTITSAVAPTFAAIPAQCAGGTSPLPTVSTNSITGTWTPPFDPNNTKTYTFIPNAGQCALPTAQVTVTTTSAVTPTFAAIPAQCAGGTSPLPTVSTNNITGTWTPAFDPNNTKTYTFIPNSGQCALSTTQVTVTITSAVTPTFAAIPAQCAGGTSPLPAKSINNITGTWTPAFDPNNTKTYTFIPNSGQC